MKGEILMADVDTKVAPAPETKEPKKDEKKVKEPKEPKAKKEPTPPAIVSVKSSKAKNTAPTDPRTGSRFAPGSARQFALGIILDCIKNGKGIKEIREILASTKKEKGAAFSLDAGYFNYCVAVHPENFEIWSDGKVKLLKEFKPDPIAAEKFEAEKKAQKERAEKARAERRAKSAEKKEKLEKAEKVDEKKSKPEKVEKVEKK
jgi:DNA-binding transcriptional MerR regulator